MVCFPNSPDLGPSDYVWFQNLENYLKKKQNRTLSMFKKTLINFEEIVVQETEIDFFLIFTVILFSSRFWYF
jgi:hypothetical protein